jgi:Fe-S-cluster containining protein
MAGDGFSMTGTKKIRLDANKQTLYFTGGCADTATCQAVCCRNWNVLVSNEEDASRRYDVETLCLCSNKPCVKAESLCINRRTRLKRKPDGACIYLDDRSACSIYSSRPVVCRTFTCAENGWKLSPQAPEMEIIKPGLDSAMVKEHLRTDCVFVKNPAIEFKTSFYSKEDREIVLIVRRVDKCGTFSQKAFWDSPVTQDEILSFIISSFDGTKDCATMCQDVHNTFGITLSNKDFFDIVYVLLVENLIQFKMIASLKQ